jgi:hypothetical protein
MPPAPAGIREDDCSQRHCHHTCQPRTWGSKNSTAITSPASCFPGRPDHRLPSARVKDALQAPATPAKVLDPAARSHEPAAITEKHSNGAQLPHARKKRPDCETPGHSPLTPARFFRDDKTKGTRSVLPAAASGQAVRATHSWVSAGAGPGGLLGLCSRRLHMTPGPGLRVWARVRYARALAATQACVRQRPGVGHVRKVTAGRGRGSRGDGEAPADRQAGRVVTDPRAGQCTAGNVKSHSALDKLRAGWPGRNTLRSRWAEASDLEKKAASDG